MHIVLHIVRFGWKTNLLIIIIIIIIIILLFLSLGGKKDDVRQDIALIENLESSLGLVLNRHKCELYSKTESTEAEFEGFEQLDTGSLLLLGAPLFKGAALDEALMKHGETLERADRHGLPSDPGGADPAASKLWCCKINILVENSPMLCSSSARENG